MINTITGIAFWTISTCDSEWLCSFAVHLIRMTLLFWRHFLAIPGLPDPLLLCYILTITLDYISGFPDPRPGQRFPSALLQVWGCHKHQHYNHWHHHYNHWQQHPCQMIKNMHTLTKMCRTARWFWTLGWRGRSVGRSGSTCSAWSAIGGGRTRASPRKVTGRSESNSQIPESSRFQIPDSGGGRVKQQVTGIVFRKRFRAETMNCFNLWWKSLLKPPTNTSTNLSFHIHQVPPQLLQMIMNHLQPLTILIPFRSPAAVF